MPIRSAIIQDIDAMHAAGLAIMAYYYFDFRDVKKQDCYGLLSSLILQLSAESDSCFGILSQLYSDHGHGVRKPIIDVLKKCMTDILSLPGHCGSQYTLRTKGRENVECVRSLSDCTENCVCWEHAHEEDQLYSQGTAQGVYRTHS